MELIGNLKTEYLLDATLETLHAQSREWLGAISFWNEEMTFFYKLMHLREPHISFPTEVLAELEKTLIGITSEHLPHLRGEIEEHEHGLARLVKNNSLSEEREYRNAHRTLLGRIYEIQTIIRGFKKSVFGFVR